MIVTDALLTSEKMHLLLTRRDGRSLVPSLHDVALAATALADLRGAGVVSLEDAPVADARVLVTSAGTTGHPVLDALLPQVDGLAGTTAETAVGKGRPKARRPVVAHLTEIGELHEHKALLNTRHVPAGGETRRSVVDGLVRALGSEAGASDEEVLLIGVLHRLNVARPLLAAARGEDEPRREFTRRLERLTRDDLLVQCVGRSVGLTGATAAAAAAAAA